MNACADSSSVAAMKTNDHSANRSTMTSSIRSIDAAGSIVEINALLTSAIISMRPSDSSARSRAALASATVMPRLDFRRGCDRQVGDDLVLVDGPRARSGSERTQRSEDPIVGVDERCTEVAAHAEPCEGLRLDPSLIGGQVVDLHHVAALRPVTVRPIACGSGV